MIPIYKPYLPPGSLVYAHDAIDSTWLSSTGKYLDLATEKLKQIMGAKYLILLNNGTSATHLVAKSIKLKKPHIKKIIVPNNVYVAAWNTFLYEGMELVPIDADLKTWNIDLEKLPDKLPEDTGLLIVHNIGNIIDVDELVKKYGKDNIVEDNCEGFLGMHNNKFSGTSSLASSLSFFGNKSITSGEGGALITDDKDLFDFLNSAKGQGQTTGKRYIHDKLGYNYRMTNIQAAILLGQLELVPEIFKMKKRIFDIYREEFSRMERVVLQKVGENTKHSNWMLGIRIFGHAGYPEIKEFLNNLGIETRPMFYPMSSHGHLTKYSNQKSEENAKILSKECLMLPSFPELSEDQQAHIIESIKEYCKK